MAKASARLKERAHDTRTDILGEQIAKRQARGVLGLSHGMAKSQRGNGISLDPPRG